MQPVYEIPLLSKISPAPMCMNLENRDNLVEGHAYEKKNKINLKRKKGVIQVETILSLPLVFLEEPLASPTHLKSCLLSSLASSTS